MVAQGRWFGFCYFSTTGMVAEVRLMFFVSAQRTAGSQSCVTIGFTSSEKFGNCGYNFCSFLAKRKYFRVVPYLGKAGSRSVLRGQRGTLRPQSRTTH